uniref:Syntaxin 6, n-terminal protein n=1 Tax=Neospora caninum (strain Liverpool) TaxID=572307 RepID=A0A0F7UP21_NEOCL|nr:TPA: syntaxin 6, n-terminal protein [Neospora caninum Liverpool]
MTSTAPSALAARADPYYAARDETAEGIKDLERSFRDWQLQRGTDPKRHANAGRRLLETIEELLGEVTTIEKTVEAAERHAARFGLAPEEVQQRRAFVVAQRDILKNIQSRISVPKMPVPRLGIYMHTPYNDACTRISCFYACMCESAPDLKYTHIYEYIYIYIPIYDDMTP